MGKGKNVGSSRKRRYKTNAAAKPLVVYLDPFPKSYSSILFLGFDKEEYFSQLVDGDENIQEKAVEDEAEKEKEAKKEVVRDEGDSLDNPLHL